MSNNIVLILVAVAGGVAVVMQAQFNGIMDKGMGTLESVFVTYALGGAIITLLLLFKQGGNLAALQTLPRYVLTAGLLGLIIIGSLSYSVPRLGLVTTFTVFVSTQFILGAVFDHFGVLGVDIQPISLQKLSGVIILLIGVWLILR